MQPVRPELITLAREARGYTQDELAQAIDVTQGALSKVENRAMPPPAEMMENIAKHLAFPIEFFSQDSSEFPIATLPPSFWRRRETGIGSKTEKSIQSYWAVMLASVKKLLRSIEFPQMRLPFFSLRSRGISANQAAKETRRNFGLPAGPIDNVTGFLEKSGVLIVPFDFGTDRIDGMSHYETDSGLPPIVCVNTTIPGDRMRFTLAHEAAHIILHSHLLPQELQETDVEHEANIFASEFLTPASDVRGHLTSVSVSSLYGLKLYWKVSAQSLLMRADDLGLITPVQKTRLWKQISFQGDRLHERNPLPREEPQLFRGILSLHETKLAYSEADIGRLLHLGGKDIRQRFPIGKPSNLRLIQG